jgi:hypothetical protein
MVSAEANFPVCGNAILISIALLSTGPHLLLRSS